MHLRCALSEFPIESHRSEAYGFAQAMTSEQPVVSVRCVCAPRRGNKGAVRRVWVNAA